MNFQTLVSNTTEGAVQVTMNTACRPDEEKERYRAALVKIAKGLTSSLAGNPCLWPSTVAYLALGGAIVDGQDVDNVDDL